MADSDVQPEVERRPADNDSGQASSTTAGANQTHPTETRPTETRPAQTRRSRTSLGQHTWAFAKELTAVVIGAIIVSSLLRAFVGQMFLIPSVSMENTLRVTDRVVVEKLTSVQRGQIVVFEDPGGWLVGTAAPERGVLGQALEFIGVLPDTGTEHLIKRLIGMPGDRVICCDKRARITINGQPLDETGYLYRSPTGEMVRPSDIRFDVTVPADRVFVMGDNRNSSRDSRCHLNDVQAGAIKGENAFVSLDLVVGRAIAVAWPLADVGQLPTPPVFAGVPAGSTPPVAPVINAGPEASC